MNELLNVDCKQCKIKEVWTIKELEYIDTNYLVYCSNCDSPQINITLNNKWGE